MPSTREKQLLRKFGKTVAHARKHDKLTQQQLAEKVDMSVVAIAYIENGRRWPRLGTVDKIARALDMTAGDLLSTIDK